MGNVNPTPRLQRFIDMGFSVEETRMALAACNDDEARALELLLERRRARERAPVAAFISDQLQEMRSWPEFFERFMWPEHLYDRVRTNLFYYKANYVCIGAAWVLFVLILRPALVAAALMPLALFTGALAWGNAPVPGLNQPLSQQQRLSAAGLIAAGLLHRQPSAPGAVILPLAAFVLGHATFRARSLTSRFKFLSEQLKQS